MIKQQLFIGAALLAGVAIGYLAPKSEPSASPKGAEKTAHARSGIADKGGEASVRALRHRIAELEKMLAERGEVELSQTNAVVETQPPRPFGNPGEWLENLKKNDPERYVQVTNRFAQWRTRRNQEAQERMDFLAAVDVSRLGPNARQVHSDLQEMIVRRDEIDEQLQQPDLAPSERDALMKDLFESNKEYRRLNNAERRNLIEVAAKASGVKGKNIKEFSATVQDVIKATEVNQMRFPPHHHGHGGPKR